MTDPTTPAERERLLALCDGATQGPWHTGTGEHWSRDVRGPERESVAWCGALLDGRADAAHIAEWDPDTCRAYLAAAEERDALEAMRREVLRELDAYEDELGADSRFGVVVGLIESLRETCQAEACPDRCGVCEDTGYHVDQPGRECMYCKDEEAS